MAEKSQLPYSLRPLANQLIPGKYRSAASAHFSASAETLANHVNDELLYVLGDPGRHSTLFADGSTGDELGYILYDAMGSVVTSTLPATLTQKLAGHLDATDLQYDGLRYYGPVGRDVCPAGPLRRGAGSAG